MAEKESPNPNIFFIIGAPTSLTLQKFNDVRRPKTASEVKTTFNFVLG